MNKTSNKDINNYRCVFRGGYYYHGVRCAIDAGGDCPYFKKPNNTCKYRKHILIK